MTRLSRLGPILLCLTLCASCSARPKVVTVPVVDRVLPPAALIQDTARPEWVGATNADLVEHALGLRGALDSCRADKAALRQWMEEADMGTGR